MASDWEISKRTGKCSATERPLAEGDAYYAVVVETPEGFERQDFTEEAWDGPPEGAFCYWRGRVPVRDRSKTPGHVDTAVLTQLFLRLEEEEGEAKQQFRFMLALLLMRKRLLKMQDSVREEGREYWRLMLMSDRSIHKVLNPELAAEQVDRLSAQLTTILSGEADAIEVLERRAEPEASDDADGATAEGDGTEPTETKGETASAEPGDEPEAITQSTDLVPAAETEEPGRQTEGDGSADVVEADAASPEREDEAS